MRLTLNKPLAHLAVYMYATSSIQQSGKLLQKYKTKKMHCHCGKNNTVEKTMITTYTLYSICMFYMLGRGLNIMLVKRFARFLFILIEIKYV